MTSSTSTEDRLSLPANCDLGSGAATLVTSPAGIANAAITTPIETHLRMATCNPNCASSLKIAILTRISCLCGRSSTAPYSFGGALLTQVKSGSSIRSINGEFGAFRRDAFPWVPSTTRPLS
jgi:hypothetical protein